MTSTLPKLPKAIDITVLVLLDLVCMNDLPNTFYSWFPTVRAEYLPVYINLNKVEDLFINLEHLSVLTSQKIKELNPILRYGELLSLDSKVLDKEVTLSREDIRHAFNGLTLTPSKDSNVFLPKHKRTGLPPIGEIWLPAERFFWSFPQINIGSARHILLFGLQLKGSGRNPIATRVDYTHSWGGQYFWQNLKAVSFSRIYGGLLPLGVLEGIGIGIEPEEYADSQELDPFTNSLLIREARSYRLTQVMTDFDPFAQIPKSYYQKKALKELQREEVSIPDSYFFQYGSMLSLGINDLNVTKENLMLNGSIMDYEDISYLGDNQSQNFVVSLISRNGKELSTNSSLDDLGNDVTFFTSNFHIYLMALKLTFETLHKFLDMPEKKIESINTELKKFLTSFNQEIYQNHPDFLRLIEKLSHLKGCYIDGIHYTHMKGDDCIELVQFLKTLTTKITSVVPVYPGYTSVEIQVQFPRGRWVNPKLESYYNSIIKLPVAEMTKTSIKFFEIFFSQEKENTFSDCLGFSSQNDEYLSQHSWIMPYTYNGQHFNFKSRHFEEILSAIVKKSKLKDFKIKTFKVVKLGLPKSTALKMSEDELKHQLGQAEEFILQGYYCSFDSVDLQFISHVPVWLKNEEK